VIALAALGCAIAGYLALYQWHVIDQVYEPFFNDGSRRVLRQTAIARFLPVPDAFLGAVAYATEAVAAAMSNQSRWRNAPWIVLVYGAISSLLAVTALLLLAAQVLLVHAFCTLCICCGVISLTAAALAAPEVMASARHRFCRLE